MKNLKPWENAVKGELMSTLLLLDDRHFETPQDLFDHLALIVKAIERDEALQELPDVVDLPDGGKLTFLEPGQPWSLSDRIYETRTTSQNLLGIENIKTQMRLQDISREDAIALGVESQSFISEFTGGLRIVYRDYSVKDSNHFVNCPIESFRTLWESVYGVGSWDSNPWVTIGFRVAKKDEK